MAAARRLAERTPDGEVACPVCANVMNGSSLAKHLASKHGGVSELPTRWEGKDFASQSIALWLGVASFALVFAGTLLLPDLTDAFVGVALVLILSALALGLASFAEKLPGALELRGDVLELTTFFGMRTRRLRLPPTAIEVGEIWIRTSSPTGGAGYHDRKLGAYLRLTGDGGALCLGTPKGSGWAKRWSRVSKGKKRAHRHLGLDREALAALEYQLAARHALD